MNDPMYDPVDDLRIEEYLRSFRPLPPAPLPKPARPWRLIALGAAAALLMGVLLPQLRRVPPKADLPPPITIGTSNHSLAHSSSWKVAIDDAGFAFRSTPANAVPLGRTALQFLSQEDLSK